MRRIVSPAFPLALGFLFPTISPAQAAPPVPAKSVGESLTLLATFDHGPDADFARGDRKIYTTLSGKREEAKPGLAVDAVIAPNKGKRGDALRFTKKSKEVVFFKVDKNLDYKKKDWGGTVSFWISVDPDKELDPDYVDPFHITEKSWDDAGLWVDFPKEHKPRHIRLGVFADKKVWNPDGTKVLEKMPPAEQPMFDAGKPPFATGKWSHVAIVFDHFNTGKKDGSATLYIDGKKQGSVAGRELTYTWDPDKAAIMLGLSYTGLLDEIAAFDRPLTDAEIKALYEADGVPNAHAK